MTSDDRIDFLVERKGERVLLKSPAVGLLTAAVGPGRVLTPGEEAGLLRSMGRSRFLVVPRGITGRVATPKPDRVHEPVGWGQVLYELEAVDAVAELAEDEADVDAAGLVVRSPQSGRFWHRPSPADPVFCEVGKQLAEGTALGLVEIMKTFNHVTYHAGSGNGGLPERAKIVRVLVGDGEEVEAGQPLIEVE